MPTVHERWRGRLIGTLGKVRTETHEVDYWWPEPPPDGARKVGELATDGAVRVFDNVLTQRLSIGFLRFRLDVDVYFDGVKEYYWA